MTHKGQRSGLPYVLQRVAVCRSVSQCVAACCSVLQHVAEISRGLDSLCIEGFGYVISHKESCYMPYHTQE